MFCNLGFSGEIEFIELENESKDRMCLEDFQGGLNEIMHTDNMHGALGIVPAR